MRAGDLVKAMESIAPLAAAADWDNVGLLLGSADDPLTGDGAGDRGGVLLTIDLTHAVLDEAQHAGCRAVLAYHPPIFAPVKRVTDGAPLSGVVLRAARAGLAVYSPHTALDAAPGAMSDWLADGLVDHAQPGGSAAGADRRAIVPDAKLRPTEELKIVSFVPADKADAVRDALASAGAGQIGKYRVCSFASPGTGTFLGSDGAHPTIGRVGRLERADELRLEMVCAKEALALALATLRQFHPYEEPAIDVYELVAQPRREAGMGRRLVLDQPATLVQLCERLKGHLRLPAVMAADAGAGAITHLGLCPGSGGSLLEEARRQGCRAFVTGEMKHHEVLEAVRTGVSVILAGHTATERGYLPVLRERLKGLLAGVPISVSQADKDPLRLV